MGRGRRDGDTYGPGHQQSARTHSVWQLATEPPGTSLPARRCRRSFDARGVITITWAPRPRRAGSLTSVPCGLWAPLEAHVRAGCMPASGRRRPQPTAILPPVCPASGQWPVPSASADGMETHDIDRWMLVRGIMQGPPLSGSLGTHYSCASAFGAGDRQSTTALVADSPARRPPFIPQSFAAGL